MSLQSSSNAVVDYYGLYMSVWSIIGLLLLLPFITVCFTCVCVCVLRVSARAIEISVPSSDGNTFCPPLHFCGELLSEPRTVDIPTVQRREFLLVVKTYRGSCT